MENLAGWICGKRVKWVDGRKAPPCPSPGAPRPPSSCPEATGGARVATRSGGCGRQRSACGPRRSAATRLVTFPSASCPPESCLCHIPCTSSSNSGTRPLNHVCSTSASRQCGPRGCVPPEGVREHVHIRENDHTCCVIRRRTHKGKKLQERKHLARGCTEA